MIHHDGRRRLPRAVMLTYVLYVVAIVGYSLAARGFIANPLSQPTTLFWYGCFGFGGIVATFGALFRHRHVELAGLPLLLVTLATYAPAILIDAADERNKVLYGAIGSAALFLSIAVNVSMRAYDLLVEIRRVKKTRERESE